MTAIILVRLLVIRLQTHDASTQHEVLLRDVLGGLEGELVCAAEGEIEVLRREVLFGLGGTCPMRWIANKRS